MDPSQPSQPSASKFQIPKLEPRKRRAQPQNPLPVPETPPLPPPSHSSTSASPSPVPFQLPRRRILSPEDHALFLASPTHQLILAWIFHLSASVLNTPRSAVLAAPPSPPVQAILAILDDAGALLDKHPAEQQSGSRFGNKTFRLFLDALILQLPEWHARLLPPSTSASADEKEKEKVTVTVTAADEVSAYLAHSFGDPGRIDYGSGHELNFFIWLLSLYQLNLLHPPDFPHIVLAIFPAYLALMRRIQLQYYLEPAGSHGVWGLDDYQFLPFLFGASQLLDHPYITPRSVRHDLAVEEAGPDYLYLDQVRFVNDTKTVRGLRWHSPMLDDISSAKSWRKIDQGMRRMFAAEVLGKLPVMQHFLFGSLIPAVEGMTGEQDEPLVHEHAEAEEGHAGHGHDGTGWGDCCGIKVPSSIGAAQEEKKGAQQPLRRIPFD